MKNSFFLKGGLVKNFLIVLFSFFTIYSTQGQEPHFVCATPEDDDPGIPNYYSKSIDPSYLESLGPVVINIFYWQVNDKYGNTIPEGVLTDEKVLASVAELNIEYNPFGIFFKYRGYDSFDSPEFVPTPDPGDDPSAEDLDGYSRLDINQRYQMWSYAESVGALKEDALNVYVPHQLNNFGGAAYAIGHKQSVIPVTGLTSSNFKHEIGHSLGLHHTHSGYRNALFCERVTRDPNDPNYNADVAGDYVTDTAAVPSFSLEYCFFEDIPNSNCGPEGEYRFYYVDEATCSYIGSNADCDGDLYSIDESDVRNFMAYTFTSCANHYTVGQQIRMIETIRNDNDLIGIETTVSELYEPYYGVYYNIGPSISPDREARFQPGFEYVFYSCDGNYPQPAEYYDINWSYTTPYLFIIDKEETNYANIKHPNHTAFTIKNPFLDSQPRKCYDNYNRGASNGYVMRFVDNVFNNNITVIAKDSSGINNEDLVNDLAPGLYKIEKNYEDGSTQETIILKENN